MRLKIGLLVLYLAAATGMDNLVAWRAGVLDHSAAMQRVFFESNHGQAAAEFQFIAQDSQGALLVGSRGLVYGRGKDAVRLRFSKAAGTARVEGLEQQPGRVNYLLGRDSSRWVRDIPAYRSVRVRDLYPGVDALYYGDSGRLEADFIFQPGAKPDVFEMQVEGARLPVVAPNGDVILRTRSGNARLLRPVVYQELDGARRTVPSHYAVRGPDTITFAVGEYDHSKPLVVDPVLTYSTYIGGSGNETATRVAVDQQGNTYLAGMTTSANYPVTSGAVAPLSGGRFNDVLVSKFTAQGALVYSTHVGGTGDDLGLGIAVDAAGQAYVTGSTSSVDFPLTAALQNKTGGGPSDAFVFALNAGGNGFAYSTYLGGGGTDAGTAITVDAAGNAYVAGSTSSSDFPTAHALQASQKGGKGGSNQTFFALGDAFVAKLSAGGGQLVYSSYYGGSNDDAALAIAVDSSGSAYVAGFTTSTDFPLTSAVQAHYGGAGSGNAINTGDAFVFKLSADGSKAVYSTYLGGSVDDAALGIAVDPSGAAYVVGNTFSGNFPIASAYQAAYGGAGASDFFRVGAGDAFLTKINPDGSALAFSTYLGGNDDDRAYVVAVDASGNVHLAGSTASKNFPLSADAQQKTFGGAGVVNTTNLLAGGYVKAPVGFGDAFYARFTSSGMLAYSTYLGGSDDDVAIGLALDSTGNAHLCGNTVSTNFPLAGSSYQKQLGGLNAQDSTGTQTTSLLFGDAFFAVFQNPVSSSGPAIASKSGVISAGAFGAFSSIAPGSWIEIYGTNLAQNTRLWGGPDFQGLNAPTSLDGVKVTVGGQSAVVDYISPGQVNAQVPSNVATGQQAVIVTNSAGSSAPFNITVNATQPGLLAPGAFAIGGKQNVVALFPDGTTYVLPPGAIANVPSRRAKPGDTILLYGVGFGAVTPTIPSGQIVQQSNSLSAPFKIFFGSAQATTTYAGLAPGFVGLYQFNVVVPTVAASDAVPVTFTLGGTSGTQTLYIAIQN